MEVWSKPATWFMEVQVQKEYYKPYLAAIGPLLVAEPEIEIFESLEGWGMVRDGFLEGCERK